VRVLIDYRPALRQRTGVGEYTHQLARALASSFAPANGTRPLELTLFSSSWKDRFAPGAELAGAAAIDRRVPVGLLNFAWHRLGWPPAEWLAGAAFDVAHSSHPLLMPARDAAQVITIHDLDFLSHPERTRAEIRRDYPALVGAHARRADAIIVSSAFTAGEVERRLGVDRDRIGVCPAGAPEWTPRANAPADGYVLFLGTLEPRKNLGGLLDAYERALAAERSNPSSKLPDLVVAGRATGAAAPWLDRIGRAPLAGRVRYVGYVEPDARRELYAGARLLVQPSFEEGFGMTVLEAMSLGVPVVAARRGSLPEVLGDAGLLVDPESADEIAAAIRRIATDVRFAAECAGKGRARAAAFTWTATADRVYRTYQQAMARRARRG
jgi:glycosyltransferase involved in cell wall biosynthesis